MKKSLIMQYSYRSSIDLYWLADFFPLMVPMQFLFTIIALAVSYCNASFIIQGRLPRNKYTSDYICNLCTKSRDISLSSGYNKRYIITLPSARQFIFESLPLQNINAKVESSASRDGLSSPQKPSIEGVKDLTREHLEQVNIAENAIPNSLVGRNMFPLVGQDANESDVLSLIKQPLIIFLKPKKNQPICDSNEPKKPVSHESFPKE